jgi:hypothetical protein
MRYLSYYDLNGKYKETSELFNRAEAILEKLELEKDGCTNVQIHIYASVLKPGFDNIQTSR